MRYPALLLLLLLTGLSAACQPAADGRPADLPAERLAGVVVHVGDGDSLVLRTHDGRRHRVRLAEIDAPEIGQPWGDEARAALRRWALHQDAVAYVWTRDRYQRLVATVLVDETDLNARLLQEGHAWLYRRHQRRAALSTLAAQAEQQRLGLWQLPAAERQPPWDWRRDQRHSSPAAATAN